MVREIVETSWLENWSIKCLGWGKISIMPHEMMRTLGFVDGYDNKDKAWMDY